MALGRPPNVLVVMTDEQSWDTLGCTGNPAARTPHLDRLAERSTVFERCYTPFPLCCPSRASLWTARMPRHHHVLGNWLAINPALRERGVATAFRDAGYHTSYTGKWHVPGTTPARMGFVDSSAIPAVLDGRDRGRYIEPYREYVTARGYELVPDHIENLTPRDLAALRDPSSPPCATAEVPLEHFLETWQTDVFLHNLDRRPDDRPWFAVCSFNAPHFPMLVPRPYDRVVDRTRVRLPESFATGPATKPAEVRESRFATDFARLGEADWVEVIAYYLGLCALVDTQIGLILDHLRRVNELDRTIVVFTSDHGDMMGAHRLMEKGHLLHYEETLRVPLLVTHPDGGAGRTANLVSVVDIAPSIAELAGVGWDDDHDGRSFATMLGGAGVTTRDHVTAETCRPGTVGDGRGEHVPPAEWNAERDTINLSVRTSSLRYVFRSRDADELYDLHADPGEQCNVAGEAAYSTERERLRSVLGHEVGDVFPRVARVLGAPARRVAGGNVPFRLPDPGS